MTQEEYDEGLAKGWNADDMLSVENIRFDAPTGRRSWKAKRRSETAFKPYVEINIWQI